MPRRIDRRDDGDIDIARAVGEKLLGLLLAGGRDGIDVEEIGPAGKMRLDRKRCINARRRCHRRNNHIGIAQRVGGGGGAAHADHVGRALELFALGFGKQNIPGGDARDTFIAQARGDRLARFAEADETQGGFVVGHCCSSPSFRGGPIGPSPESITAKATGLSPENRSASTVAMGSGLAPLARPGMTLLMTRRNATLLIVLPQTSTLWNFA